MLSKAQIQQAIQNLNLLIANPDTSAHWFTLNNGELITKNWLLQTDDEGISELESYLQGLIDEVSSEDVDFNDHSYLSLFISLQYFLHLEPNQILEGVNLNLANNPYLQRKELNLKSLEHMNPAQVQSQCNSISNQRALIEFDTLLQSFVTKAQEPLDLKAVLLSLLDSYQSPWHASFTRNHLHLETYKKAIKDCQDNRDLLLVLNAMEFSLGQKNQHEPMQSLIHYGKWLIEFTNQHQDKSLAKFKEYFVCQELKRQVAQETRQMLGENRAHFFTKEHIRCQETASRTQSLVR
ncbi:hypothetical protein BN59_03154 [Legionella massiliensis]|uniref:Uncharacterized protein n=1 Tax=Legionella massiliensis TaxID=1034943 RepID=A0A078KWJ6_9GAMM|nr:hypothetical protein [Legionella massiliensis]CDZ78840.1 hypothetical protein BN59_03154 [Legionella massiliensis]CEE14578.1 hypothetical protein BN1094_03154 [Legionella massiliensis]